jgi:hypothetical protein
MTTIEDLQKFMEECRKDGAFLNLYLSPDISIDVDAFVENKYGIVLFRKGHNIGFVSKDVLKKMTPWDISTCQSQYELYLVESIEKYTPKRRTD